MEFKKIRFSLLWFFGDLLWFFKDLVKIKNKRKIKNHCHLTLKPLREVMWMVLWVWGGWIDGFVVQKRKSNSAQSWGRQKEFFSLIKFDEGRPTSAVTTSDDGCGSPLLPRAKFQPKIAGGSGQSPRRHEKKNLSWHCFPWRPNSEKTWDPQHATAHGGVFHSFSALSLSLGRRQQIL